MNIMYTVHMHASIYTAVSKKVVPQKSQTLNSKRSRCDRLLKAQNVRILHCNYGKTDYKHLRCTTSSVLALSSAEPYEFLVKWRNIKGGGQITQGMMGRRKLRKALPYNVSKMASIRPFPL
jgi:hypothetical protein